MARGVGPKRELIGDTEMANLSGSKLTTMTCLGERYKFLRKNDDFLHNTTNSYGTTTSS